MVAGQPYHSCWYIHWDSITAGKHVPWNEMHRGIIDKVNTWQGKISMRLGNAVPVACLWVLAVETEYMRLCVKEYLIFIYKDVFFCCFQLSAD